MSGPKIVWAVTSGSYSDYRVRALFEDEATAKSVVATQKDHYDWSLDGIEGLVFYPAGEVPSQVPCHYMQVEIWDDGHLSNERAESQNRWDWDEVEDFPVRPKVRWVRPPIQSDKGGRLEVRGRDLQGVQQAFSDCRARIIVTAEQTGKATIR